ncbi:MAG: hypothetical protein H6709_11090 [Kofleriaceae bacterium]|nr:hypothetical protein [Myxococcales bacterium]MCB9572620.1 hypothetical protein [Kofleriaceae bacterium]
MLRDTLRRSSFTLLAALLAASGVAVSLSACSENPVGRKCDLGVDNPNPNEAVLASPSLDCQSRTCLKVPLQRDLPPGSEYPSGNIGLCTADCEQDSDCDRVPESPCTTGFTCAIPVVVGPFCCQKKCICKDYIVVPEGGVPTPEACDASNAANGCCNLDGRRGSPDYPTCL